MLEVSICFLPTGSIEVGLRGAEGEGGGKRRERGGEWVSEWAGERARAGLPPPPPSPPISLFWTSCSWEISAERHPPTSAGRDGQRVLTRASGGQGRDSNCDELTSSASAADASFSSFSSAASSASSSSSGGVGEEE